MKYFVLVYDRPNGKLIRPPEVYPDAQRHDALTRRFELEREFVDRPDYEIVVLGGESEEAIRRTHGRYFKTMAELLTLPS